MTPAADSLLQLFCCVQHTLFFSSLLLPCNLSPSPSSPMSPQALGGESVLHVLRSWMIALQTLFSASGVIVCTSRHPLHSLRRGQRSDSCTSPRLWGCTGQPGTRSMYRRRSWDCDLPYMGTQTYSWESWQPVRGFLTRCAVPGGSFLSWSGPQVQSECGQ